MCQNRLLSDGARTKGKSNVTYTSGKRRVVVCNERPGLGDATGRLLTAGREGALTSNEQDIRENRAKSTSGHCALPQVDG